jgi:flagellar M-ring protein FliF
MNFLNEIGKQIRDLFASMTPSARIMAGLMVAVVVISLGWILSGGASGPKTEYMFGGRNATDAELSSMEVAFGNAGLGDYERVGQRIKIPSAKKSDYLKAISSSKALPGDFKSPIETALDSNGPFDPQSTLDRKYEYAKQQLLENTIKRHAGIQTAIVNYDEKRVGFAKKREQVCSIAVQGLNGAPVPQMLLKNFARLATKTFAGLTLENISVTDMSTSTGYFGSSGESAEENAYFIAQTTWENYFEQKVNALLTDFNAKVAVNVTLDPTMKTQSEQLQYQQQPVAISSLTLSKNSENTKAAPGGQPGAGPNGVSNQAASVNTAAAGQNSKVKETQENQKSIAGHEATVKTQAGLVPKSVYVTIGIPESHYRKVALQKFRLNNPGKPDSDAPTPTDQELTDIRTAEENAVRSAVEALPVGAREGDDRKALVKVYNYIDLPEPEVLGPTMADNTLAWVSESWSTLALIGLVLVSLGMMFSWMKSPVAGTGVDKQFAEGFGLEIPSIPLDQMDIGDDGEGSVDEDGRRRPPALEVTGTEMKEDLSTIIKENPDAAVNLIKSWIGEAAA